MKQTIKKNDISIKVLNKLIINGFYNGSISSDEFELERNYFPNNYRIVGTLNSEMKYEIRFDFKRPMNFLYKIYLVITTIIMVVFLYKFNWILPLLFLVFEILRYVFFKIKAEKEIDLFTSKFLEFYIREEGLI